tara:strand:+ start:605 stop:1261 length:657 start_codon:yes stop_codon:yes gene_type:complete
MAGLTVTVEPTQEPVTLQEVKEYLRLEDSVDERNLRPMLETARRYAEEYLGMALMSQTLTLYIDTPTDQYDNLWEGIKTGPYMSSYKKYITLPRPPVISVTHVKTYDDADTATTFASSRYYVDTVRNPARVCLRTGETWPSTLRVANAIEVKYVAGYASPYTIPEPIRLGILQHIAYLYEHRGDMYSAIQPMPPMLKTLYAPYKVYEGLGSSILMASA